MVILPWLKPMLSTPRKAGMKVFSLGFSPSLGEARVLPLLNSLSVKSVNMTSSSARLMNASF